MTWKELLERDDIIGGDLETREGQHIYRGPIEKIEIKGDCIYFTSPWTGRKHIEGGSWENWHINVCYVNTDVVPQDIGNNRIYFSMPYIGSAIIYPKGGSKLDPRKVKGLEIN